jgi:pyruvate kinase
MPGRSREVEARDWRKQHNMKKTKIICTIGPKTDDPKIIRKLAENGMDIARFNFSHGNYEEHLARIEMLRSVREETGLPIAMLLDTKGPEIRTGMMKGGEPVILEEDKQFILTTKDVQGDAHICHVTYGGLPNDVKEGDRILIDDGLIELTVVCVTGQDIHCTIKNGGELGSRKGINVPKVKVNLPAFTEKDKEDLMFGIAQGFDFIAASFVRNAECVREIKSLLNEHGVYIPVIAKIENAEGVENLDEILREADGIMIARGDLGVEIPAEQVPHLQKQIIRKCNEQFKSVITATQMLDSMIRHPRPTRAEVTDVANAVYDGTDVVMLSGETASGKYPLESLQMMAHIVETAEEHLDYAKMLEEGRQHSHKSISNAVSYSSVAAAHNLNAVAIITPSLSGFTARQVSKYRPKAMIIGTSPEDKVLRKMQIYWGVRPLKAPKMNSTDRIMENSMEVAMECGVVKKGDLIVITAGVMVSGGQGGRDTNLMKIEIL